MLNDATLLPGALLVIAVLLYPAIVLSSPVQELTVNTTVAREGYVTLKWNDSGSSNSSVNLQIANDPGFRSLVRNLTLRAQHQIHLSGLENGVFYARLVNQQGQVLSSTAHWEVKHRSLQTAWLLFSIGLFLFSLLLFFAFRYTRPTK